MSAVADGVQEYACMKQEGPSSADSRREDPVSDLTSLSDHELIEKTKDGDEDAFGEIISRYKGRLINFLYRMLGDYEEAVDLTQETFIEIMRSIGKFRGEAALGSWIRRIAVTKALMFLRSAWTKRGQSLADDWSDITEGDALSHGISRHPDDALDLDAALAATLRVWPEETPVLIFFILAVILVLYLRMFLPYFGGEDLMVLAY